MARRVCRGAGRKVCSCVDAEDGLGGLWSCVRVRGGDKRLGAAVENCGDGRVIEDGFLVVIVPGVLTMGEEVSLGGDRSSSASE